MTRTGATQQAGIALTFNTHKPASLCEAFPAAEARGLVERFEWHYTPKHGSWLNMAESELGRLPAQAAGAPSAAGASAARARRPPGTDLMPVLRQHVPTTAPLSKSGRK
jgi:hypothetical protein